MGGEEGRREDEPGDLVDAVAGCDVAGCCELGVRGEGGGVQEERVAAGYEQRKEREVRVWFVALVNLLDR